VAIAIELHLIADRFMLVIVGGKKRGDGRSGGPGEAGRLALVIVGGTQDGDGRKLRGRSGGARGSAKDRSDERAFIS